MDNKWKVAICHKIKTLRKNQGYSQEEVAAKLNMSQNSYSRFEAGETKIDVERLMQIAALYKVSVYEFLIEVLTAR